MKNQTENLLTAIRGAGKVPVNARAFVITGDGFFRLLEGRFQDYTFTEEYGYAKVRKLDRGPILNVFAKMEFIVNECLNLYFLGPGTSEYNNLDNTITKLGFRQRIETLREVNLINGSFEKRLKDLAAVRNHLAHEWDEKTAKYKTNKLTDEEIFDRFSLQLCAAFKELVSVYRTLQINRNYTSYLEKLCQEIEALNQP